MISAPGRLTSQLEFVVEIDKLKNVLRQTLVIDGSRRENSAEHSWHLATMALLLSAYAAEEVDLLRVLKMLLVHDIVEIDAGDTFAYDEQAHLDKADREDRAADRLFGILPEDLAIELRDLWNEFESRRSADARFAAALDRLQPLVHNYNTAGVTWRKHGVTREQVVARNGTIAEGSPELWDYALALIDDAVARGFLAP